MLQVSLLMLMLALRRAVCCCCCYRVSLQRFAVNNFRLVKHLYCCCINIVVVAVVVDGVVVAVFVLFVGSLSESGSAPARAVDGCG